LEVPHGDQYPPLDPAENQYLEGVPPCLFFQKIKKCTQKDIADGAKTVYIEPRSQPPPPEKLRKWGERDIERERAREEREESERGE